MHRFLRHILFFLVVAALWLNYGLDFAPGELVVAGEAAAASSDSQGTNPHRHDHGPTGNGDLHHCVTASCTSIFMVQAHRAALRDSDPRVKFGVSSEGGHIRSTYLDRDPPIPRISA